MGDGIVNQTFTANITDLENKMAQAERVQMRLVETIKKIKEESKEGHSQILHGLQEQGNELIGMVTKYASVGVAIEAVVGAYEHWEERLKKIAEANDKVEESLVRSLAKAGIMARGKEVEHWEEKNIAKGFTRPESQAALFGAAAGAPGLGFEKQMAIADQTVQAAPLMPPEELQKFSETVGRMQVFMPDKKSDEVKNIVMKLRTRLGATKADELTSRQFVSGARGLVESGAATPEEALALGEIALKSELSPQFLEQIASKVIAAPEPTAKRGHRTAAEEAKVKFHDAGKKERLQMLLENPEMQEAIMGSRLQGRAARIRMSDIQEETKTLEAAGKVDMTSEQVAGLSDFEAGRETLRARGHEVQAEKIRLKKDLQAKQFDEMEKFAAEKFAERDMDPVEREIAEKNISLAKFEASINKTLTNNRFGSWLFGEKYEYTPQEILRQSKEFSEPEIQEFNSRLPAMESSKETTPAAENKSEDHSVLKSIHTDILTNQATNAAHNARQHRE
jgi:uncharacterized protein YdhG (YjbR/CyaY superfamily)